MNSSFSNVNVTYIPNRIVLKSVERFVYMRRRGANIFSATITVPSKRGIANLSQSGIPTVLGVQRRCWWGKGSFALAPSSHNSPTLPTNQHAGLSCRPRRRSSSSSASPSLLCCGVGFIRRPSRVRSCSSVSYYKKKLKKNRTQGTSLRFEE